MDSAEYFAHNISSLQQTCELSVSEVILHIINPNSKEFKYIAKVCISSNWQNFVKSWPEPQSHVFLTDVLTEGMLYKREVHVFSPCKTLFTKKKKTLLLKVECFPFIQFNYLCLVGLI